MLHRISVLTVVLASILLLAGCEYVDSEILETSRNYFPRAELQKPNPRVLQIETHVGNISRRFAHETFDAMLQRNGPKLYQGMQLAGYRWLILGFDDFNIAWDTQAPGTPYWVLNAPEFIVWVNQRFAPGTFVYPRRPDPALAPIAPTPGAGLKLPPARDELPPPPVLRRQP